MKRIFCRILCCFVMLMACYALPVIGANAADPMRDFDYARYASDNPDVMRNCGPDVYREKLYQHYVSFGISEGRAAYSLRTGQPFVPEENAQQAYQTQGGLTDAKARINNAVLTPDRSWPEPVLELADQILAEVGGITPYERLRGCYDWIIQNCYYGNDPVEREYESDPDLYAQMLWSDRTAKSSYDILKGHVGVCTNYSAAFVVLARMIGFDARLQDGYTHMASGGMTGHTWCIINIHGVDYVFDPQVEDNIAAGGAIRYLRFCKTYEEVPDKYLPFWEDVVQDSVMAGSDAPTYAFGHSGSYFTAANQARAEAGLAPLAWDSVLARAALRIALGEDGNTVLAELERQTGRRCFFRNMYGTSYSLGGPNLESRFKSVGIGFCGLGACMVYSEV